VTTSPAPAPLLGERTTGQAVWDGPVIDVDVHAAAPVAAKLFPFLSRQWVDWCTERNWQVPPGVASHYPPNYARACRPE
jgi:uncharacterized protein